MANKNPCDRVEVFMESSIYELRDEMNSWLKANPDFYIDQMTMTEKGGYYSVVCDLCLREDIEDDDEEKDDEVKINLSEHLLEGLIEAVNELTDTVKTLTEKK